MEQKRITRFVKPAEIKETLKGTYQGTFIMGKFKTAVHKIELESGEILGLNTCQNLKRDFAELAEGAYVSIKPTGAYKTDYARDGYGFEVKAVDKAAEEKEETKMPV